MKKTTVRLIAVVLLLLLSVSALFACQKSAEIRDHFDSKEKRTVLFLGDSIAEAMAGPSPITERETYGYYGILGRINDFTFYNRAVSGDKTRDLLAFIQREDDGVNMVKSLVSTADILHVSIGGNDLLGYDIGEMIIQAGRDNYDLADQYLEIAYNNLDKIITKLREMNPEAIIVLQTLYNPVGKNSPLVGWYAKMRLNSMAYTENDYHRLAGNIIDRLNDMYVRYLEENKNKFKYEPFYLVDVASYFEEVYKKSPSRWSRLFCPDGIHPANEGHALIAEANQKFFEQIGIASKNALKNYKEIRSEQLSRLYSGSVEVSSVKKNIADCENYSDVTKAYFNAVDGKDVYYRERTESTGDAVLFEDDKVFDISKLTLNGVDLTKVYVSTLGSDVDIMASAGSYISFCADGTFEMKYVVDGGLITILKQLSEWGVFSLPINLNEFVDIDIKYLQKKYLEHMFPGFDYADINTSLELLSETIEFSLTGFDFSTQAAREMARELAETGNFILRDLSVLGNNLGITWKGNYRIVEQVSELTGQKYYAIYIGQDFYKGETYLRFTYTPGEDGADALRLTVDVIDLIVEGSER